HSRNAIPRGRQRQGRRNNRDSRFRTASRARGPSPCRAAASGGESAVGAGSDRRPHTAIAREPITNGTRESRRGRASPAGAERYGGRHGRPRRSGSRLSARALRQRRLHPAGENRRGFGTPGKRGGVKGFTTGGGGGRREASIRGGAWRAGHGQSESGQPPDSRGRGRGRAQADGATAG